MSARPARHPLLRMVFFASVVSGPVVRVMRSDRHPSRPRGGSIAGPAFGASSPVPLSCRGTPSAPCNPGIAWCADSGHSPPRSARMLVRRIRRCWLLTSGGRSGSRLPNGTSSKPVAPCAGAASVLLGYPAVTLHHGWRNNPSGSLKMKCRLRE